MSAARARHDSGITRGDLRAEILSFDDVTVGYGGSPVLDGATFNVRRGEVAGVVSLDGRGRSTLVKCAAGLIQPAKGEVLYEQRNVYDMTFAEDQKFRARSSVVLEGGALLVNRSIFENVALPLRYHLGMKEDDLELFVDRLLLRVGYTESPELLPWQVSARARKLAAIARALVREPELVLMDRFFESLDTPDSKRIMELVLELNVKSGTSFLIVGELSTHIFQVAERVVVLEGGKVIAHDFKRGLFKNEKIKRAFEEGEEQLPSARETRPFEGRPLEDKSAVFHPEPLATQSSPFSPDEDSDQQPVVVLEPPTRRSKKPRRSSTFAVPRTPAAPEEVSSPGDSDATVNLPADPGAISDESERTVTLDPGATAELVRQARDRAADRLEREASALESRARPNEEHDRELLQSEVVAEFRDAQAHVSAELQKPEFTERPTRELTPLSDETAAKPENDPPQPGEETS